MKLTLLISIILIFNSCSTMKKSKLVGAATGTLICGFLGNKLGKELSPNRASETGNQILGLSTGVTVCGVGGYFIGKMLYEDDPRNHEYEPIKFQQNQERNLNTQQSLNTQMDLDVESLPLVEQQKVLIPELNDLPNSLKSKVQKQEIIRYKVEPKTYKTEDGRTIHFSGGEAIEHRYKQ